MLTTRSTALLTALLIAACSDDAIDVDPFKLSDPRADMPSPDLAMTPDMPALDASPTLDASPDLDPPDLDPPDLAPPLPDILFAAGFGHTCAARDGALYCWGSPAASVSSSPALVPGMESQVSAVAAGNFHTCAIKAGALYCWGLNDSGQVGVGSDADSVPTPTLVPGMERGVSAVSAGTNHTCALRSGELHCWGDNLQAQLGDPAYLDASAARPRLVPGMGGASIVSAGGQHTCAARDGKVWCWGDNTKGQVGPQDTGRPIRPPQRLAALERVSKLTAGLAHTCIIEGGAPSCWGNNGRGQLGDGSLTDSSEPTRISPVLARGVVAIAAGSHHTCALLTSSLYCWGDNSKNQSGVASLTSTVPIPIEGFTEGVTAFATGANHTCAAREGQVWCWGDNSFQQIEPGDVLLSGPTLITLP